MKKFPFPKSILSFVLYATFVVGVVLFVVSLVPGDFSLLSILQRVANRFVQDGSFESVNLSLYNRLRGVMLFAGAGMLAASGLAIWSQRRGRVALAKGLAGLLVAGYLLGLAVALNLATARLNAYAYRYFSGTPLAYQPTTPIPPTPAPTPSPRPTLDIQEPGSWEFIHVFEMPVIVTHAGDGSGRVFIGVKKGKIRIFKEGELLEVAFLDIRDRVLQGVDSPEQGFLGLAFHPNYAENGYFYVNYIDRDANTVISRFQVSSDDPNVADPDSETPILGVIQLSEDHNGGQLAFGPDGYLYIGLGDGGVQRDPYHTGQSIHTLLGKILRIDVDNGAPYSIPPDNPFANTYGRGEIWAYGLRNPWQFSFDQATGDMFIGDVGHKAYDEINFLPADHPGGANFGWSVFEGPEPYETYQGDPPVLDDAIDPIVANAIRGDVPCAIIGGMVYYGEALPRLQGVYIYGDFCAGIVWGLRPAADGGWERVVLFDTPWLISAFGVDEAGELYVVNFSEGVYKLVP